jgi:anaerobic magnesium-protoporphyrin IX monomethyl ester cyclase
MKIILTHGYFLQEDEKEKEIMKPYPPLGILYLSAWLEQHDFPNTVFDSTFSSFSALKACLLKERPEVLAIYTNLMTKLNVLRIIQFVRSEEVLRKTKIILGGPEVRSHKEKFLEHGADIIVFGEGEETILELARHYSGENILLEDIKGIARFDERRTVVVHEERALRKDINELPFPARQKINLQSYLDTWKQYHGHSVISLSTMRGCPYTCKWCSRAVYGGTYRRRSPIKTADEMQWLIENYTFDRIWFVDDVFTISHKWLKEFSDEMIRRKLNIPYEIITRADRMNAEVIQLLKQSGCFRIWIGAESGSQKVIEAMDRRVDVLQVREMIRLTRSAGIEAGTFIMLGYPGETDTDVLETLHHLKTSDPDLYTITVAYPISGTRLYEEVESSFIKTLPWESSTDRDIDFKRTYTRNYYKYAVRYVYNEVALHKQIKSGKFSLRRPYLKLKAMAARGGMLAERMRS